MKIPLLTLLVPVILVNTDRSVPTVNLPLGKVEGDYAESSNGRIFYSFKGVPYAEPPVGKYRFKEPSPVTPWKGVWKAKRNVQCIQYRRDATVHGEEDCLYLNIFTPTLNQESELDVIVHIHGGGFIIGHGDFDGPDFLLNEDVVYINFNYRLGPLGFLSTEDDIVPGNNGLKDQIMALRWIKDNVKYFGGNPGSVTIAGSSAGSASVHAHIITPKSRGLFHKAYSMSGTVLNPWVLMEKPLEKTRIIAQHVSCDNNDINELVECLRWKPARTIVDSVELLRPWNNLPMSPFGLVVDSWSSDPIFIDHPYDLIKNGSINDVPWIVSHVKSEGLCPTAAFCTDEKLRDVDTRWNELFPHLADYNYTIENPEELNHVSQKIRKHYLGEKKVSKRSFKELVQLFSDRFFIVDIHQTILLQSSVMRSPLYFYYFTYRGRNSFFDSWMDEKINLGAVHGDDGSYIFKKHVDVTSTKDDKLMMELFIELITSFAKHGKPKLSVNWPPVSKRVDNRLITLKIASPTNLTVEAVLSENIEFWNSLPFKENQRISNSRE